MHRLSWRTSLLAICMVWQTLGASPRAFGQASDTTTLPNVTITTNQSQYRPGDQMTVTLTTSSSPEAAGDWFPLIGLLTPATGTESEVLIYRFEPEQEFLTLDQAVNRLVSDESWDRVAARPADAVSAESVPILDEALPLGLPAGFPNGSYLWVAMMLSADGSQISKFATAPFTVQPSPSAALPSCEPHAPPFSTPPLALPDIASILPLGNLSPPAHTFPTRHLYFHIKRESPGDYGTPAAEVPLVSPGEAWITNISVSENLGLGKADFDVWFSPCEELTAYFFHVSSLSPKLQAQFVAPYDRCDEYTTGGQLWRLCSKNVQIAIAAGEIIGTAGGAGQNALDLGAFDSTTPPLQYANPSRWNHDPFQLHVVCALEYFVQPVRQPLEAKLGYAGVIRTAQPICGEVEQDEPGTAQGVWFVKGTTQTYPEDPHLSLVHDNVEPAKAVFSVGTSMSKSGLPPGAYHFHPTSFGLINRDFNQVSADGNIYCYEPTDKWSDAPLPSTIILLQLFDATTLRLEKQPVQNCQSGPWAFGSTHTDFER